MKSIFAFFRLIRWPNLVFIALTQFLFWQFILPFSFAASYTIHESRLLSPLLFWTIVLASVCIAAAGYIINDYFDINIDQINKSDKVIVGIIIKRRAAILLHAILSLIGFGLSIYVGKEISNLYVPFFNLVAIAALLVYSTTFKKKLLVGNILISLLTAWVIVVLSIAEYRLSISVDRIVWQRLLKLTFIYAGFAFIISLVREVIKDMEDMEGDRKYGCTTMPIVWGIQVSKVFTAVWIVVLTAILAGVQIYLLQLGWMFSAVYTLFAIIIPLVWVLRKLYEAKSSSDFHLLSMTVKLIMLTGILTMVFF
jgi:4-hydroxybenzoate polyprenyltransferase